MYNWALVEIETGKIINALSTPTEGVGLESGVGQKVIAINRTEFDEILAGRYANLVSEGLSEDSSEVLLPNNNI